MKIIWCYEHGGNAPFLQLSEPVQGRTEAKGLPQLNFVLLTDATVLCACVLVRLFMLEQAHKVV
jgi:hypothetical protein